MRLKYKALTLLAAQCITFTVATAGALPQTSQVSSKQAQKAVSKQLIEPAATGNSTANNETSSQSQKYSLSFVNQEVNPANGSLSASVSLITAKGYMPLSLIASYSSQGSEGALGLPKGWGYNIDHITPNQSVHINGNTSPIDPLWSDVKGYHSGLKYINNHGFLFKSYPNYKNLPKAFSDKRQYKYLVSFPDGSQEFFDAKGKLLIKSDKYSNFIAYHYLFPQKGIKGNYIKAITDSLGQQYHFSYDANSATVSFVDSQQRKHRLTLYYDAKGVKKFVDADGLETNFSYIQKNGHNLISSIIYPTGKESIISYTNLAFKNRGHGSSLNAVKEVRDIDLSQEGKVIAKTQYSYGSNSNGRNFTGYPLYDYSYMTDNLFDHGTAAFHYDVKVIKFNDHDEENSVTDLYYDSLSRLVQKDQYTNDQVAVRQKYTYPAISSDRHRLAPTYTKPNQTVVMVYNPVTRAFEPKKKILMQYDDYGNTVNEQKYYYDQAQQDYQLITSNESEYNDKKILITSKSLSYDPVANSYHVIVINNTLSQDQSAIIKSQLSYANDTQSTLIPWKTTDISYGEHGSPAEYTVSWSDKNGHQQAHSVTQKLDYDYNPQAKTFTIKVIDPLGHTQTQVYDSTTADLLKNISATGLTTAFKYNLDGQIVSKTDPAGYTTNIEYGYFQKGNQQNYELTTSATGQQSKTIYDASQRVIELYTTSNPLDQNKLILMVSKQYDLMGNLVMQTDQFGNKIQSLYNGLGLPISAIDKYGNHGTVDYDLVNLTVNKYTNGVRTSSTQFSPDFKVIQSVTYPNVENKQHDDYAIVRQYQRDGNNQTVEKKVFTQSLAGSAKQLIATESYVNNVDNKLVEKTLSKAGDVVSYHYHYDLLDNLTHATKDITYANGKQYHVNGVEFSYDDVGNLIKEKNASTEHNTISYQYDADNRLIKKTDLNGQVLNYGYNNKGLLSEKSWLDKDQKQQSITYTYSKTGLPTVIEQNGKRLLASYYPNGDLKEISYPDGEIQRYQENALGQVTATTDVNGQSTSYKYLANGNIDTIANGKDQVRFEYGTNSNGIKGSLLKKVFANLYTQKYHYDGSGRVYQVDSVSADGNKLLSLTKSFLPLGQIKRITSYSDISQSNKVNYIESFDYDGLGQVIKSNQMTQNGQPILNLQYQYDGNGNILSKTANDNDITTYHYNAIDQLTSYSSKGDTYALQYDQNGNEIDNGKGQNYRYNALNQLMAVKTADGKEIRYDYYPNGLRSDRMNTTDHHFYYDANEQINAINSADNKSSYFIEGNNRVSSFDVDSKNKTTGHYVYNLINNRSKTLDFEKKGTSIETKDVVKYSPYGQAEIENQTHGQIKALSQSFLYNGELTDPDTQLVYMRARDYDPSIERFTTMDTYHVWNRYNFSDADPINKFDPSGHLSQWDAAFIGIDAVAIAIDVLFITGGVAFGAAKETVGKAFAVGIALSVVDLGSSAIDIAAITHKDNRALQATNIAGAMLTTVANTAYMGYALYRFAASGLKAEAQGVRQLEKIKILFKNLYRNPNVTSVNSQIYYPSVAITGLAFAVGTVQLNSMALAVTLPKNKSVQELSDYTSLVNSLVGSLFFGAWAMGNKRALGIRLIKRRANAGGFEDDSNVSVSGEYQRPALMVDNQLNRDTLVGSDAGNSFYREADLFNSGRKETPNMSDNSNAENPTDSFFAAGGQGQFRSQLEDSKDNLLQR